MKKGAIARLIIWSVTALILVAMLVCGIIFGKTGNISDWNFFIVTKRHSYANEDKYTVGGGSVSDKTDDIEINWIDGKINVESYDGEAIEISETPVKDRDMQLRYLSENGKLIIQYKKSGWVVGITKAEKKELTVKIPISTISSLKRFKINCTSAKVNAASVNAENKFEIDNVSGTVYLKDIVTNKCEIDTVSGDINIENLKADIMDCDTVSGDITVTGEIGKIETDSTSGEVTVTSSICPTEIETDSVSGDVRITIPDNDGFSAKTDSVSGDFESDFAIVKKDGKKIYGDGSANFEFDSVSGDIFIKKLSAD